MDHNGPRTSRYEANINPARKHSNDVMGKRGMAFSPWYSLSVSQHLKCCRGQVERGHVRASPRHQVQYLPVYNAILNACSVQCMTIPRRLLVSWIYYTLYNTFPVQVLSVDWRICLQDRLFPRRELGVTLHHVRWSICTISSVAVHHEIIRS